MLNLQEIMTALFSTKEETLEQLLAKEEAIREKLGLFIPEGVTDYDQTLQWRKLFVLILELYKRSLITEQGVQDLILDFDSVILEDRDMYLDELYETTFERIEDYDTHQQVVLLTAQTFFVDQLIRMLPADLQEQILYFEETGEQLTPEIRARLRENDQAASLDIGERLINALDRKNTLDLRKGQVYSPEQVAQLLDADTGNNTPTQPSTNPDILYKRVPQINLTPTAPRRQQSMPPQPGNPYPPQGYTNQNRQLPPGIPMNQAFPQPNPNNYPPRGYLAPPAPNRQMPVPPPQTVNGNANTVPANRNKGLDELLGGGN